MILRRALWLPIIFGITVEAHLNHATCTRTTRSSRYSRKDFTYKIQKHLKRQNQDGNISTSIFNLRGGGEQSPSPPIEILPVENNDEKEKVAFVSNTNKCETNRSKSPSKVVNVDTAGGTRNSLYTKGNEEKQTQKRLDVEINKNLKERFSDATISLQKLMELQNLKPMAINFSKELMELKKEKIKPMAMNFSKELKTKCGETASKLYQLKLASIVQLHSLHQKVKEKYNIEIKAIKMDYSSIKKAEQVIITAKNWMKDGALGVLGSEASYILLASLVLSSVGSSLGFVSFLYFVSVGYGASIGIIAASALIFSNFISKRTVPLFTNIHTGLALLWSLRLTLFLLHREYINWPEWHGKLLEVDERANTQSRITIWMTCSVFYAMMMMPCVKRMKEATSGVKLSEWGKIGKSGIYLQGTGLLLETISDFQKGRFKRQDGNRNKFCNVGVWNFFSHPNYFGEILFWVGTYVGGVACNKTASDWIISSAGLLFILTVMKGASDSLDSKHMKNYGYDKEYMEFRRQRWFFGPIPSFLQRRRRKITNIQQYTPAY